MKKEYWLFLLYSLLVLPFSALSGESLFSRRADNIPDPRRNPDNYISVDFDRAPLAEVVFLISDYTGAGFVCGETDDTALLTWTQQKIYKDDLTAVFLRVLTSAGFTVHRVEASPPFWSVRSDSALIPDAPFSSGIYQLQHISSESLKDTAKNLYGGRLSLSFYKDNQTVVYSGTPSLVREFTKMLKNLDVPPVVESSPYLVLIPLVCTDRSGPRCLFQNSWFPVSSFPYEIRELSGQRYAVLDPFFYEKLFENEDAEEAPSGVLFLPRSRFSSAARTTHGGGRVPAGAVSHPQSS